MTVSGLFRLTVLA